MLALYVNHAILYTMKMTREHFRAQATLCADIISELQNRGILKSDVVKASIIDSFQDMCERANPKFDRLMFSTWVENILTGIKNN